MKAYNSSDFGSSRKKMRTAQHTDVEDALFQWFKNVRDQNIPISGPTLAAKADDLVIRLGHTYFTANHNWVERYKQRRGIVSRSINGESAAVDETVVEDYDDTEVTSEEDLISDREALLYISELQRKPSSKSTVPEKMLNNLSDIDFFPEMHRHFACSEDSERLLLV
jgi:hypothetical protein